MNNGQTAIWLQTGPCAVWPQRQFPQPAGSQTLMFILSFKLPGSFFITISVNETSFIVELSPLTRAAHLH